MDRANRRRRRSSGSGLDQAANGGEVTPTPDKVPQQSNTSMPLQTPEADGMMENGPVTGKKSSGTKFSGSHRELVLGLPCRGQFEFHRTSSKKPGGGVNKNVLASSHKRAPRSKEVVAASTPLDANPPSLNGSKKSSKYMNKVQVREDDEYTKIKKKLRYFLNRINYEQNLIDAYSLEGWKGSSAEKLRPEKELERAKKEILRRKVNIRELFQHLDTLCAQGNIPESLFNSDGEISSEDIFCSKCGSKDLHLDNDIILCDGFCDRGFHQYCVEPPLRKEDIPPDDESWLCPGCNCKDYSFDLLNDSLGTKLSVSDSWEKVFPEAAAAMAGGGQNLDCDLPSDDSEDEEYDPDGLKDNEDGEDGSDDCNDSDESENEDESSDESASDEMIGSFKDAKDIMALPSDDSEDDDYDPDAPIRDEDKMQESSNSDNTSDSEDVETSSKGDESDQQDEVTPRVKPGRKKSQLPGVSISESDAGIDDGLSDVPGRRKVERLDYKKLYDEEYENVPTSSSDDEDWDKKEDPESGDEGDIVPSKAEDHTSTQKPKRENKKVTLKAPEEGPIENGCSGHKSSSASSKQTNPKTQRLFESFQENRYPDISTRENLAKELQMTVKQVDNWFRNTRFSTSKTMASKEDAGKLRRAGKECEGETSVAGSSKQSMETEPVAENRSGASESTSSGSRKRRRR